MNEDDQIALVGGGLAGLTVARALVDAGHRVVVFDKGRGLGGRMATRRTDGWRFDHGAVALRPTDEGFANLLTRAKAQGHAAQWHDAAGWVGLPGMSGFVKPMAAGLTVHNQAEVTGLERRAGGWVLHGVQEAAGQTFDHVVLAIPQPQALRLLAPWPHLQARIERARMAPCWTVMAGFKAPLLTDVTFARSETGVVSVLSRETAKPGRDLPGDGWVIQAGAEWSQRHLERDRADVEGPLLAAFFAELGCKPVAPTMCMAHRWRFALTSNPLRRPFLQDTALGLSICGDWCLGATAQDAFDSGHCLATALLSDQSRASMG